MEKKQPAKKFFVKNVTAAIWQNEGPKGPFYSVTFSRSYRDGEDYKDSSSFGLFDLTKVIQVAAQALAWISFQSRDESEEKEAA